MTDHDPFGPPEDDKTVQYPSSTARPQSAGDGAEDKTVQYQRTPPLASQPPPVWHSTGKPAQVLPPTGPVGPPPPSWQQPAATPGWFPELPGRSAPPASSNRRWWFVGGGLAAALVVIAMVSALVVANSGGRGSTVAAPSSTPSTSSTPATSDEPSTTSSPPTDGGPTDGGPTGLAGLLLSATDVSTRMQSPGMVAAPVSTDLASGTTVTPSNCASTWTPADGGTYAGSAYTGVALQEVKDPATIDHQVDQAVVSFADEQTAKAVYDARVADWSGCKFQQFSTQGNENVSATSGAVGDTDGTTNMLVLVDSWPGSAATQCERAITARQNVVVDVRACSPSVGSAGWTIARDIGQKITGQR